MNKIRGRLKYFIVFTLLGFATTFVLIAMGEVGEINILVFMTIIFLVSAIAIIALGEYFRLKDTRLIKENPILRICNAKISDLSQEELESRRTERDEVIISYFGILMGSRIIRFNQEGIRLRDVEIGEDFISLTYGKNDRLKNTRILKPLTDAKTLDEITEKFSYETGIKPRIIV